MRVIILLSCILAVSATISELEYANKFAAFKATFNKQYGDDELVRFNTFKDNYGFIQHHNAQADAGIHSFHLGVNQFADMTNDEYRSKVLGLSRSGVSTASGTFDAKRVGDVPSAWDWREKNVVTPVKDQGQCGSCWAFSATGAMETAHALATGKLLSLSEQLLVDCVNGGADDCQHGGEMSEGFTYVIGAGGDELEQSYPYRGTSGNKCAFDKSKTVATFSSYQNVTSGSESDLAAAIATHGAVSVAIDASSMWFQLYSRGVFDLASCKNGYEELDHGVLAVGYGHDATSGKDYWIVKNSWNVVWGNAGYIWMSRNKNNQCGIATDASFPLV